MQYWKTKSKKKIEKSKKQNVTRPFITLAKAKKVLVQMRVVPLYENNFSKKSSVLLEFWPFYKGLFKAKNF